MDDDNLLQDWLRDMTTPTCTNKEIHDKYADRGIEDQCPYCIREMDNLE